MSNQLIRSITEVEVSRVHPRVGLGRVGSSFSMLLVGWIGLGPDYRSPFTGELTFAVFLTKFMLFGDLEPTK